MMNHFTPETFGELNADDYDLYQTPQSTDLSVDVLHGVCGAGRVFWNWQVVPDA